VDNPYVGYGKVVRGERLVGRVEIAEQLSQRLLHASGSMALIGVQRIGKSSLAKEIVNRVRAGDGTIPFVQQNLGTITDPAQIFQQILDEVVEGLQERRVALPARLVLQL
jgi:AAA+ ATPase superfamily predicted ATPase